MKHFKYFLWIVPAALLAAGCTAPVYHDNTIAEWQREGMLPPTGDGPSRVYPEPARYPATTPNIVVQSNNGRTSGDLALADNIRRQLQYDAGLAPSLQNVTIAVDDGAVILQGTVKSELDARVIVDDLRDVAGVSRINDELEINPEVD